MKKSKRPPQPTAQATAPPRTNRWWPWAAAAGALFLAFEAYTPALHGEFVLDDLYQPFADADAAQFTLHHWMTGIRPLLRLSYGLNYYMSGTDPYPYHALNVFLHFLGSIVIT